MKISSKDWQNYIATLRKINETAAEKVAEYMRSHDCSTPEGMKALIDYAHAVATKYGEGAAELSCEMLDEVAEASGAFVPAAEPAATATYGEIAKTIYGTMAATKDPDAVGAAVGRSVKLASVDTLQQNALRDGAEWAWIPAGDTCPFCLMLASRGWVKASKKAIKNGHADHIHNNCDCTYCVRYDGETTVEGYDPDALYEQYKNAGDTPRERLNALRRQHYAANKDYINAQKRVAYARRRLEKQSRLTDGVLHSEPGEMRPPLEYNLDFRDYKELSITEAEKEYIKQLHRAYSDNGFENGLIIYGDGAIESRCNNHPSGVDMSIDDKAGAGVKLYHNHTNRSLPSAGDLKHFTDDRIDEIGVITPKGETYIVRARGGDRPTKKDFEDYVDTVSDEVRDDLKNYPDFYDWDLEERQYMYFMLRTRRIITHYGWELEGGMM